MRENLLTAAVTTKCIRS